MTRARLAVLSIVVAAGVTGSVWALADDDPAPSDGVTVLPLPSDSSPTTAQIKPESQAAEAFIAFATGAGGGSAVPWAEQVTYSIGGEEIATFDAAEASAPDVWVGCPAEARTYEGRDCPVSPLRSIDRLADEGNVPTLEEWAPEVVGCSLVTAPPGVADLDAVSIRPFSQRDCFSDLAVTLYFDRADRIADVNFVMSGS